jgi:hypothetical protein
MDLLLSMEKVAEPLSVRILQSDLAIHLTQVPAVHPGWWRPSRSWWCGVAHDLDAARKRLPTREGRR